MRYYAVIDTNVLVSAMLKFQSVPGKIANEALLGDLIPLLSEEIIAEYREVFARPKFKFDQKNVEILIDGIVDRGIFVDAVPVEEIPSIFQQNHILLRQRKCLKSCIKHKGM